jgi:membrane fusion protein (multidrug efflux system)
MRQWTAARGVLLAVGAAAIATLSACGSSGPPGESGDVAPQVAVVTLKTQSVKLSRQLPGRTRAFLVAEVRPQVTGIVKQRLFTEGGYVKAGQPLYEIDDAIYRAQYQSAKASLLKAQATLQAAQLAATRSRELADSGAVSAQDNENAIAAEAQAHSDVGVARAAVTSTRVSLEYAHIVAPISGRIGKSNVTQGALVTAAQVESLATIQQLDPIYVEVNQSSSSWLALKRAIDGGRMRSEGPDAMVKIQLDDGIDYANDGKLQFADATVDPSTGNFMWRAIVPNPQLLLRPGMYVRAEVNEGTLREAVLAPQQGISRDSNGNATALVVGKGGKVEPRIVRVSRTIRDQWLIENGLAAGDRLIVEGVQKAEPGAQVQAEEQVSTGTVGASQSTAAAGGVGPGA